MPTAHLHRFLAIVPAARIGAFNTWVRTNLDPSGSDWVRLSLVPILGGAATHGWFSTGLTNAELKKIINRLCSLTVPAIAFPPAGWDDMTRIQKRTWIVTRRLTIYASTGIYYQIADGDGVWDEPEEALTFCGLKRQGDM